MIEDTLHNYLGFLGVYVNTGVTLHYNNRTSANEVFSQSCLLTIQTMDKVERLRDIPDHFINKMHDVRIELTPVAQIKKEHAFEVARILHGESDDFAIEFDAAGITSVSPYGLPCYTDTVNIHWSGEVSYERATSLKFLEAYEYLRSEKYAVPYKGVSVEQQIQQGWIVLTEGEF